MTLNAELDIKEVDAAYAAPLHWVPEASVTGQLERQGTSTLKGSGGSTCVETRLFWSTQSAQVLFLLQT